MFTRGFQATLQKFRAGKSKAPKKKRSDKDSTGARSGVGSRVGAGHGSFVRCGFCFVFNRQPIPLTNIVTSQPDFTHRVLRGLCSSFLSSARPNREHSDTTSMTTVWVYGSQHTAKLSRFINLIDSFYKYKTGDIVRASLLEILLIPLQSFDPPSPKIYKEKIDISTKIDNKPYERCKEIGYPRSRSIFRSQARR